MAPHRERTRSEDGTIEAVRKFVAKWGTVLTICGAALGILYEHKRGVDDLTEALRHLREDCDARHRESLSVRSFGDAGFTDPQIRAALDLHLRKFLQSYTAAYRVEAEHWRRVFFRLNPALQQPPE